MTPILIAVVVALVVIGPLLMIWSLNTLFALAIPYTLSTWVAATFLSALVAAGRSGK